MSDSRGSLNVACACVTAALIAVAVHSANWPMVALLVCLFAVLLVDVGVEAVRR